MTVSDDGMKAPKCRICQKDHYGLCPTLLEKPWPKATPALAAAVVGEPERKMTRQMTPHPDCPVCAARRKANAESQRKHRWKQKEVVE